MSSFVITKELIEKIDLVLSRGLSKGLGNVDGKMCVEAAICYALGEPHGDKPSCVEETEVNPFKITLNDSSRWVSEASRAVGMRSLAIAQLGSKGVVDPKLFRETVQRETIKRLIPALFREIFPNNKACLKAADRCEREGTTDAAANAAYAAYAAADAAADAARAARAAADAAYAADAADAVYAAANAARAATRAAYAADAAANAAYAAYVEEKYLLLMADIGLQALKDQNSPGCAWL
jgi:hypothetical protein